MLVLSPPSAEIRLEEKTSRCRRAEALRVWQTTAQPSWRRTIKSPAAAVLTALVIGGRRTYLQALMRRVDAGLGTSISTGRIARFAGSVETQMLDLLRGNPARLAVLLTATVLSYLCMALEAWVILRATGVPISAVGALAVETFSRVAASILDGCDGEIARLKYQESALGCWIERVGDYSYYVAIFIGLTIGAVRHTHIEAFYWLAPGRSPARCSRSRS